LKRFTPRPLIIAISFLAVFAISVASYAQSGADSNEKPKTAERTDVYHDLEIFTKILEKVSQNYVNEVDTHKLMKKAIDGMLSELDPHSHLSSARVANSDILIAFKEVPHIDFADRAEEVVELALRTARDEIPPPWPRIVDEAAGGSTRLLTQLGSPGHSNSIPA